MSESDERPPADATDADVDQEVEQGQADPVEEAPADESTAPVEDAGDAADEDQPAAEPNEQSASAEAEPVQDEPAPEQEQQQGHPEQQSAKHADEEEKESSPSLPPDSSPPVFVSILVSSDGFHVDGEFPRSTPIAALKEEVCHRLQLDPRLVSLWLSSDEEMLDESRSVGEYKTMENRTIVNMQGLSEEEAEARPLQLTLMQVDEQAAAEAEAKAEEEAARVAYRMPDVIKVVINREEIEEAEAEAAAEAEEAGIEHKDTEDDSNVSRIPEQVVYVQVIRDNLNAPKPFLGGFRHKYYGTTYHHASTQTARRKKPATVDKFERDTQTVEIVSRSSQTNREAGTQMERSDIYMDHSRDRILVSRPYFSADELESLRDSKARELQCFLRQCFAWRRVRRLREGMEETIQARDHAHALAATRAAEDHKKQIARRMHPRTKHDFAVLHAELDAWRLHETARIKESGLSSDEIARALEELLHKEVKLLQTIDRLKLRAARENASTRTQIQLETMASPKEWSSREGDRIEVETPFTQRAKELVDLYNGLCLRGVPRAQRIDILLHVKYTVKEFDCELSREIIELIRREEDLLRRQRSETSLEGCRKRIQTLFLHFLSTPAFNPEAATFLRAPDTTAQHQHALKKTTLSSSLAKPAMLINSNTLTIPPNAHIARQFKEDDLQPTMQQPQQQQQ